MTEYLNGVGLHVLFDAVSTNNDIGKLVDFVDRLRPAVLNFVGAARRDQCLSVARYFQQAYPGMRVIFRIWPDDGNWCKDIYRDPAAWVKMAAPFLATGLTVLADNESITADLHVYSDWHAKIMDLCGLQGWKVAVGRFATGNPEPNQVLHLDSMLKALHRHGNLHTLSPNEYQSQKSLPGPTGGHTRRLDVMLRRSDELGLRHPDTSVGEWALAYESSPGYLDPGKSYRTAGWGGRKYAQALIDLYRNSYQAAGIPVAIYCWGDSLGGEWKDFRVDTDYDFQQTILEAADNGLLRLPQVGQTKQVVLPPGNSYVNLRESASSAGNVRIIGRLVQGQQVIIDQEKVDLSGILWYHTTGGWVSSQGKPGNPRVKFV